MDHNIAKLTGHGTFYCMEMIETVKPGEIKLSAINRLKDREFINESLMIVVKSPWFNIHKNQIKTKEGLCST